MSRGICVVRKQWKKGKKGRKNLISVGMVGRVRVVMWESGRLKGDFRAAEQYENCQSRGMAESDGRKDDFTNISGVCFFEWITPSEIGMRIPEIYLGYG